MKTCPYCAEEIQDAALVCKHCGKDIGPGHAMQAAGEKMKQIGCGLTLLITLPILVILFLSSKC